MTAEQDRARLGMMISGGGTTMEQIALACRSGELDVNVAAVIASRPGIRGIERALDLRIPQENIVIVDPRDFKINGKVDRVAFGQRLMIEMEDRGVDVITQNGWIPKTPTNLINQYDGRLFNQHPGPVPEFGGKGMMGEAVHLAVTNFYNLVEREGFTQAIAQHVDKELDGGGVVEAEYVDVFLDDTAQSLQERVLPADHRVQIALLKRYVSEDGYLKVTPREQILFFPGEENVIIDAKEMAKRGEVYRMQYNYPEDRSD